MLAEDTIYAYAEYLGQIIAAELPEKRPESSLFELTENVQLSRHLRTC